MRVFPLLRCTASLIGLTFCEMKPFFYPIPNFEFITQLLFYITKHFHYNITNCPGTQTLNPSPPHAMSFSCQSSKPHELGMTNTQLNEFNINKKELLLKMGQDHKLSNLTTSKLFSFSHATPFSINSLTYSRMALKPPTHFISQMLHYINSFLYPKSTF